MCKQGWNGKQLVKLGEEEYAVSCLGCKDYFSDKESGFSYCHTNRIADLIPLIIKPHSIILKKEEESVLKPEPLLNNHPLKVNKTNKKG